MKCNTSTTKVSYRLSKEHEALNCGETSETEHGVHRLGLAPLHCKNGYEPLVANALLSRKQKHLIEFTGSSFPVGLIQFLLILQICVLIPILMGLVYVISVAEGFFLYYSLFFYMSPLLVIVGGGTRSIIKMERKNASSNLPFCFHSQRQEVSFSFERASITPPQTPHKLKKPKYVFLAMFTYMSLAMSVLVGYLIYRGDMDPNEELYGMGLSLLLFLWTAIGLFFTIKPWVPYLKARRAYKREFVQQKTQLVAVPWEQVSVEYQYLHSVSISANTQMHALVFMAKHPQDDDNVVMAQYSLGSKEAALHMYEFIRQYMDTNNEVNGQEPEFFKQASALGGDYNRAGYKRLLQKRWQKNAITYLLWRLFYIITLKYWAHWVAEYLFDIAPKKMAGSDDFERWSQPIPKEQWHQTTPELKAINNKLNGLYKQGCRWESQKVQSFLAKHRVIV